MEGRSTRLTSRPTSSRDHAAIATAAALFTFLLATKLSLLLWHVFVKGNRPLADVPADGVLYLAGWDLLLCLNLAVVFFAMHVLERRDSRIARAIGKVARAAIVAGLVIFCVASFQVARIYGEPLDVELLRAADSLIVMRESISAYTGPMPIALLLYGLIGVPLVAGRVHKGLAARQWLRMRWQLWGAVACVCLAVAAMQKIRLARIDTFGVKDNAVLFFIKEYQPPYRPIDAPRTIARLERQLDASRRTPNPPKSLVVPSGKLARDFAFRADALPTDLNVILIQIESASALHTDAQSSPNVFALQQSGLDFKNHLTTATQTRPASIGLYYSDYMPELGTTPSIVYGGPMPQPALAEVLKSAGYRTGVFHTGFLNYVELRYLFANKGVDTLVGAREMIDAGAPMAYSAGVREERTVEELCRWIAANKSQEFFAAYLSESPHHPYVSMADAAKRPFPDDTWLNRYKNALHYTDAAIGKMLDFLKSEGLMERTLIVVVGDHGETVSQYPVGHGLRVSAEEMRTPFVLHNRMLFPEPLESRLVSSHLDVAPTIVRLLGLTPPRQWLGRNLVAEEIPAVMQFVSITHIRRTCVVDNGLIFSKTRDGKRVEAFELGARELVPLSADDPRRQMSGAYAAESDWFAAWSAWRHLKRAHDRGIDLAQHHPPAAAGAPMPAAAALGPGS
jgi:phosphoglycerol transferase MdoB-like AlkP superfamily enzyme